MQGMGMFMFSKKDFDKAEYWFVKSLQHGNEMARQGLDMVRKMKNSM
jgi:hypothetical protein